MHIHMTYMPENTSIYLEKSLHSAGYDKSNYNSIVLDMTRATITV